ncbi:hypothetical protein GUITHDRAFT_122034 [Guillardia theta CCMP2712]|uniref:Uncharacterized protein n=1 Tax=Guillardia theta (strain CCMP2712) TaxID=905079 RepID=L1I7D4_GUITC|nr:hypothetical protein GUITHDRAFT_122034 [Guillardia theta CCMP2712]EKX31769.1 hypothetical protein GUITHDRAFT_122034 [Guillardia theta CCMP2712]|eukprot:XP_005818749.1 hypothetical protein GUITHDRAFT_122034 [Guillardia theta CCMP2712]
METAKKETLNLRATAKWHEGQAVSSMSGGLIRKQRESDIRDEIRLQSEELKVRRKQQMLELYNRESEAFERELNELGLARAMPEI